MSAEQGILVAEKSSLEVGSFSVGIDAWAEPFGIDSISVGNYTNVGSPSNAIRFSTYPPQSSIDIAWLWPYQPPNADTSFIEIGNGPEERALVAPGRDQLETELWQASPTQYVGVGEYGALQTDYLCVSFWEGPLRWQVYPPSLPVALATRGCYKPQWSADGVEVSYSAQDRELVVISPSRSFLETELPGIAYLKEALVEGTDQQDPGLPEVLFEGVAYIYPPVSPIIHKWTQYYKPPGAPVSYGGVVAREFVVAGVDSAAPDRPIAIPTEFVGVDGRDFLTVAYPLVHHPLFFGWFIYPPPPSVVIRFFDGWKKPLINGSINLSVLYQIDPYQPLSTLVWSGGAQTEYEEPWVGEPRILVPSTNMLVAGDITISTEISIPGENLLNTEAFAVSIEQSVVPTLQQVTVSGVLLTEYWTYAIDFPKVAAIHDSNQLTTGSQTVSHWRQTTLVSEHSSLVFALPTVSIDQWIDVQWAAHLLPGTFYVLRELEITVYESNQFRFDEPSIITGNVVVSFGDDFFIEDTPQIYNVLQEILITEPTELEFDWPILKNSDWHITPAPVLMTLLPTDYETQIFNKNKDINVLGIEQTQTDWEGPQVRFGLVAAVDENSTLCTGNIVISNWEQFFATVGVDHFAYGMHPALRNTAHLVVLHSAEQSISDISWIVLGERFVHVASSIDQVVPGLPIVGQSRIVEQIPRESDVQTKYQLPMVSDAERFLLVESMEDDVGLRPRWICSIERRVIDFEKYGDNYLQTEIPKVEIFGFSVKSQIATDYGTCAVSFWDQAVNVLYSQYAEYSPISVTKQQDVWTNIISADQMLWSAAHIYNEHVMPIDPTQYVYHPFIERIPPQGYEHLVAPSTLYGDIFVRDNIVYIEESDAQTQFGVDWRLDTNTITMHDGKIETNYNWAFVSYLNRNIEIFGGQSLTTDKPSIYNNTLFIQEGISFTNCLYADWSGPVGCDSSAPVVENKNRDIKLDAPGDTPTLPGLLQIGEFAVTLSGGVFYIDVGLRDHFAPGSFELWPHTKRSFVTSSEQLATELPEIALASPPTASDKIIEVTGLYTFIAEQFVIELLHRNIVVSEKTHTIYGDNYPMVHFDFKIMPQDTDTSIPGIPWAAKDPQEILIEDSDQSITWYDTFDDQLRVEERPQFIRPLGWNSLLTARPGVIR